ncbi:MAG: ATP-grasp domain-containing protein [Clostridia bacterium]|nr:ATP-grasp domain-containing protein [Clostridia bacterium]
MERPEFTPVLLGGDQNVYGMARSFYEAYQIKSVCVAKINFPVTLNSTILTNHAVDDFDKPDVSVSYLRKLAEDISGKRLLVSCGDNYSRLLSQCSESLCDLYEFCVPKLELIDKLCVKENFYATCREFGLSYPKTEEVTKENFRDFTPSIEYPVVIKASDSVAYWNCRFEGKKKVFVAHSEKEFKATLEAVYSSQYDKELIIQEFIPGADDCMRVINAYCKKGGGVRFISLGHIILEEHTAQGIGSYAAIMGANDDELCLKIKDFLEKIGYEGFINIDLKRDPRNGDYKFFEINPRQGRSSYFVTASGHNLAHFLTEDLILKEKGEFEIGHGECVWSIIPKKIINKYVKDPETKKEIERQMKKSYVRHLWWKHDRTPKRALSFAVNQYHYFKKYRDNFNKKGFFD